MLGLYLGSIAVASLTTGVYAIKAKRDIKKEGLKIDKTKVSKSHLLQEGLGILSGILVPGINLIYTVIVLVLGEDIYEGMKNSFLDKGYIYTKDKEVNKKNSTNEKSGFNTRRASNKKKYEDLSREEKRRIIQKEIRDLIEERTNISREYEGPKLQLKKTHNRNKNI